MRIVLFLLCAALSLGAQDVRWIGPEPARVMIGGKAVLRLVVAGSPGDLALSPLPIIEGLDLSVGRPESVLPTGESAESRPNETATLWRITATPRRVGRHTVERISVVVAGKTIVADPVSFDVDPDPAAAGFASVETWLERTSFVVDDTVPMKARFVFDSTFFAEKVILLFQRPIGIEAMLDLPYFEGTPGLVPEDGEPSVPLGAKTAEIAVNGKATIGTVFEILKDGKKWTVIEIERRFRAKTPGRILLPAPIAKFAYASRFVDDFLNGKTPVDRVEGTVVGESVEIFVATLPSENRPPDFSGAIGRFSIAATVSDREIAAGRSFRVRIEISGDGNLESAAAPRFPTGDRFAVKGMLEEKSDGKRIFDFEVGVMGGGAFEIPPITFVYFDPREGEGYRTIATAAIPIVAAGEGATVPTSTPERTFAIDLRDLSALCDPKTRRPRGDSGVFLPIACLVLPWAFAAFLFSMRRRAREMRKPAARIDHAAFRSLCDRDPAGRADLFVRTLAHVCGVSPAAVVGPELRGSLTTAGISDATAESVERAVVAGLAERYGGPEGPQTPELAEILGNVDREIAAREVRI